MGNVLKSVSFSFDGTRAISHNPGHNLLKHFRKQLGSYIEKYGSSKRVIRPSQLWRAFIWEKSWPLARAKTLQQHSHMHWLSRPLTELTQLGESNNYTEKSWRARLGGFPYRRKRVARPFVRRSRWKSSGRRVTPGITFLHKSGALDCGYKLLFYFTVRCVSRVFSSVHWRGVRRGIKRV